MIKISKVFILLILLLFILSPFVLAITPQGYAPMPIQSTQNHISDSESQTVPIETIGVRILRIVQVFGTIISIILMPVCLILGIMYIAKSKSSTVKKFIIGFIIILFPYMLFTLTYIISIIFLVHSLF